LYLRPEPLFKDGNENKKENNELQTLASEKLQTQMT